jgi:hypothetical protein
MIPVEDLLRQTFAEREGDVEDVPLLPAPPRRPRRAGVVLAGAAAVAVVLVGTTVAIASHRSASDRGTRAGPASPSAATLRYAPAPIVSARNRTSAILTWAPTWTPAAESGREVTSTMQSRFYGWEDGRFAAVTVGRGDCASLQRTSGFTTVLRRDQALANSSGGLCRALPGGGALDVRIAGAADPVVEARRIADSIRTGRRDEVALPVSLRAGTVISRLSATGVWEARSRWEGNITTADGTDVYVGPQPEPLRPNQTVGGRRVRVDDYPSIGTMVRFDLAPAVWTNVLGHDHDRTVAIAAGLHLGPIPDYPWTG